MKKTSTIPLELLKANIRFVLYLCLPTVIGVLFLFMDIHFMAHIGIGIVSIIVGGSFLFLCGTNSGKAAYDAHRRLRASDASSIDPKRAGVLKFVAYRKYKPFVLIAPITGILAVFLLIGTLVGGIGGGMFRFVVLCILSGPGMFTRGIRLLPYMQLGWAGFGVMMGFLALFVGLYVIGYLISGYKHLKSEADMIREMKSFDF